MLLPLQSGPWLPLGIILASLISEDAATASAALLAVTGKLSPTLGFVAAFVGIWAGDLMLFAAARLGGQAVLRRKAFSRVLSLALVRTVQGWFQQHGALALVMTRFVPGTRFLTYVTAGASQMKASLFAFVTAICALVWVGFIFAVASQADAASRALSPSGMFAGRLQLLAAGLVLLGCFVIMRKLGPSFSSRILRFSRWEFWPAWLFYPPVALMCVWLGVKHRGFALPSIANPGQRNGGIIGESKIEILDALRVQAPGAVAKSFLIPQGKPVERATFLQWVAEQNDLTLPLVLKPDTAQRGAGFHKLLNLDDAPKYFHSVTTAVVAQEYAPGPEEAGIFYYRFPGEAKGKIFSITHKEFPAVVGDGVATLEELILADRRAAIIAETYLSRFSEERTKVIPAGQTVRLVEAGNHCQGCIFRNGAHLMSSELEDAIDAIARTLPGFYVGRFDIRYSSPEQLRQGQGFKIIELNGAASEATDIYDPSATLASAYRTLYRQWNLVYAIGAENRRRGARPASLWTVLSDWLQYQRDSALYPAAD